MNYLWWKNFLFWHAYAYWLLHVTVTPKTLTILQSPPKQRICTMQKTHWIMTVLTPELFRLPTVRVSTWPWLLISEYIDRQDATFKEYGTYSVEGNIMTLINGEDKQYYKVGENTLTALNQDKQAITGELADHYILHKK